MTIGTTAKYTFQNTNLCQVEAIFDLEGLAEGPFLGTRAHDAGRDPASISSFYASLPHPTSYAFLPQFQVDGGQSGARDPRIKEWVGYVECRPLDRCDSIAGVANRLG